MAGDAEAGQVSAASTLGAEEACRFAGANHLEVKVTNLWHNRIVGDLRSPETGVHARTNLKDKFSADMELLPSGLLGPVVLRSILEIDVPLQ